MVPLAYIASRFWQTVLHAAHQIYPSEGEICVKTTVPLMLR